MIIKHNIYPVDMLANLICDLTDAYPNSELHYDLEKDKIITERIKRGIIITGENNQKLIDFDMSLDDFNTDDIKKLTI